MKCCRIKRGHTCDRGCRMAGPDEAVYHCCDSGQKLLPNGPPQTPLPLKQARCAPVPLPVGLAIDACATPPDTCVPGATMSGFLRLSERRSTAREADDVVGVVRAVSPMPRASEPPNGLTFSAAPTVMTFFARRRRVERCSRPSRYCPRRKRSCIPDCPASRYSSAHAPGVRLRVAHQRVVLLRVCACRYCRLVLPQLLLLMRAPS